MPNTNIFVPGFVVAKIFYKFLSSKVLNCFFSADSIRHFAVQSITCWFNLQKLQVQGTAALQSQNYWQEGKINPRWVPYWQTPNGLVGLG